jgi:FkbM family methyltransferase
LKIRLKYILQDFFKFFGYKISKLKTNHHSIDNTFTMHSALQRCVKRGLKVATVIDVGASDGRWSSLCMKELTDANYFLVEAQQAHQEALQKFKENHNNVNYVIAAAGESNGTVYFDNTDLFGGVASTEPIDGICIKVPTISLDSAIVEYNLKPPYLLKLDTHGFEIPILEGAKKIIEQAELIIIETYNYKITDKSLKYYEMCNYMSSLGFLSIEMVDLMLRKHDDTFWQMDTFFIPKNNKSFTYNSYK